MEHRQFEKKASAQEQLVAQCVAYFKENPHLHIIMQAAWDKYRHYGKLAGSLSIEEIADPQTKEAVEAFLGGRKPLTIRNVQKALDESRFAGCSLKEVVEEFFEEILTSKKEDKQRYEEKRQNFFDHLCNEQVERMKVSHQAEQQPQRMKASHQTAKDSKALEASHYKQKQVQSIEGDGHEEHPSPKILAQQPWFRLLLEDPAFRKLANKQYAENKEILHVHLQKLEAVLQSVEELGYQAGNYRRLAELSAQTTGDPHALDRGRLLNSMLTIYLRLRSGEQEEEPADKERQADLFYRWGLIGDEVSNHTLCCGLQGMTSEGKLHLGMQGYAQEGEPHHLSVGTLSRLNRVWGKLNDIFVVENPTVFITLSRAFQGEAPFVCTSGFLRMASLALLDLCVKGDCTLHYSGDMDPEGLLIADRLKKRYKKHLVFWRMDEENYKNALSDVKISETRKKKMEKLEDGELQKIATLLVENNRCAYQEMLMDSYLQDVRACIGKSRSELV